MELPSKSHKRSLGPEEPADDYPEGSLDLPDGGTRENTNPVHCVSNACNHGRTNARLIAVTARVRYGFSLRRGAFLFGLVGGPLGSKADCYGCLGKGG